MSSEMQVAFAAYKSGEWAKAERLCLAVLGARADDFDALNLLGAIAGQSQRLQEAAGYLARAIASRPDQAAAHNNFGSVIRDQPEQALASFDRAIALRPDYAQAYNNRGNVLLELKRLATALASFDKALSLAPDYPEAHNNRGNALMALGRVPEALASFDKAVALKPGYAEAHNNRANALKILKRLDEALAGYEKALELNPDYEFLLGTVIHARMQRCDWRSFTADLARLEAGIAAGKRVAVPMAVPGLLDNPQSQRAVSAIYAASRAPKGQPLGPARKRTPDGKIRVGYYSADFHDHATSYLMAELFESHDARRFEIHGFSFGPDTRDGMRRRVSSAFHRFSDVRTMSDLDVASMSRECGIDIAVDLKGYTQDSRPEIFAAGCAPVQVNYLGYPGTMGVGFIDYVIADRVVVPVEQQVHFTEKLVYLPHCYQVNDSTRKISTRHFTREELGLPATGFVFCCFNNNYKILPSTFDSWVRVLQAVPHSVLWLLEDNAAAAINLRKEAAARGLDPARLVFARRMPIDEHLARHRLAGLFLDTLPYNAHTTASDALWAGLPVLTQMGTSFASRVAGSLLHAVDLPELICRTQTEYEAMAIYLALHPARLEGLRARLEQGRRKSPLFDAKLFARHLESAYEVMYARCQAGLAPERIDVWSE